MARKQKSKRQQRRSSDGPMPQGGAGLIRFYQDQSNGIKMNPIVILILSGVLIVVVILGHLDVIQVLLGF